MGYTPSTEIEFGLSPDKKGFAVIDEGGTALPMQVIKPLTAAQFAAYTGRRGEIVEVTDAPGRPQYRWDGVQFVAAVTAQTNPADGRVDLSVGWGQDAIPVFRDTAIASIQTGDIYVDQIDNDGLSLPNPYPSQANAPVHPGVLFFPSGWNGARYWMAYTPYPGSDSQYENPCVASSQDGAKWVAKGAQPLVDKPSGGYNADTHLFMSPDGLTMYLAFRERNTTAAKNRVKVMHTTDGASWSAPVTIKEGAVGSQDYASPSIWWNGSGWTMISHNLDGASPHPVQRTVSSSADIYGAWGAPAAVTVPAFGSRQWWHSFHVRLPLGQIVALFQDNLASGQPGFIYWAESVDDGQSFTITTPAMAGAGASGATGVRGYRSAFVLRNATTGVEIDLFLCDLQGLRVLKHTCRLGAFKLKKDFLARQALYLSLAETLPFDVAWADTFNRADSAASLGTATSGGTYSVASGTWGVSSNRAYPVASGKVLAAAGSANHEVSARFTSLTSTVQQWLVFRSVDSSNCWRVGTYSNAAGLSILVLQSVITGAISINKEIGVLAAGDVVTARAYGPTVDILVNGIKQHTEVMTTNLTGASFGLQANAGATTFMDNLTCVLL